MDHFRGKAGTHDLTGVVVSGKLVHISCWLDDFRGQAGTHDLTGGVVSGTLAHMTLVERFQRASWYT